MKKENNDIKKLFKSFGADANEFQELARVADANEAESRWPLLSSVQPSKRELPPLLSKQEKSQSWHAPDQHAQRVVKPPLPIVSLGAKISSSLKQQHQSRQTKPSTSPSLSALPLQTEPVRPSSSAPSFKLSKSALTERLEAKPKGLFSFAGDSEVRGGHKPLATPEDAMSSVFRRIGRHGADASPTGPVLRKGLLGRSGRP